MKWFTLSCASLICILLVSCARTDALSLHYAVRFDECSAPCWQGLAPGVSTIDDVETLLERRDPLTILVSRSDSSCQHWELAAQLPDRRLDLRTIGIQNGRVHWVESASDLEFSLRDVISRFGEPEYVEASITKGPDGELAVLEVQYPSKGLAFVLWPDQSKPGMISPSTQVRRVQYFAPGDLASYVRVRMTCLNGVEGGDAWVTDQLRLYQPWQGYGQMQVPRHDERQVLSLPELYY